MHNMRSDFEFLALLQYFRFIVLKGNPDNGGYGGGRMWPSKPIFSALQCIIYMHHNIFPRHLIGENVATHSKRTLCLAKTLLHHVMFVSFNVIRYHAVEEWRCNYCFYPRDVVLDDELVTVANKIIVDQRLRYPAMNLTISYIPTRVADPNST